jgi:hypothetical protein
MHKKKEGIFKMYDIALNTFNFLVKFVGGFHYVAYKLFEVIILLFMSSIILAIMVFLTGTFLAMMKLIIK